MGCKQKDNPKIQGPFGSFLCLFKELWCDPDSPKYTRLTILTVLGIHVWKGLMEHWFCAVAVPNLVDALKNQDADKFYTSLVMLCLCILAYIPQRVATIYAKIALRIKAREFMTRRLLDRYFVNKNYYHAASKPDVDNPGIRIVDDVEKFVKHAVNFFSNWTWCIVFAITAACSLYSMSPMLVLVIPYSFLACIFCYLVWGRRTTRENETKNKRTAELQKGLIQTNEYAEAVAFLEAEQYEKQSAFTRFNALLSSQWAISCYESQNEAAYRVFTWTGTNALHYILLIPVYLNLDLPDPGIGLASGAASYFGKIIEAIFLVIEDFSEFTVMAGAAIRLEKLRIALDELDRDRAYALRSKSGIARKSSATLGSPDIIFEDVCLDTPGDAARPLVQNLTLTITPGSSVIIMGPSGVGKSSLMRAVCGLWQPTSGSITLPEGSDPMFLPQTPYIPDLPLEENSLRAQLLFPKTAHTATDEELTQILAKVNLAHKMGEEGLDTCADWRKHLSGGEKQRLAMARLLLSQPAIAFLDEASSALDSANENLLYRALQDRGSTYISVGHKDELLKFHKYVLNLQLDGKWTLSESPAFKIA